MRSWLVLLACAASCDKQFNYDYCKTHPGQYPDHCGLDASLIDAPADAAIDAPPGYYTIGGTVSGLSAGGLVLRDNGGDDKPIAGNGMFTFDTAILDGLPYSVTVKTQPTGESCNVANASGMVASANVTNVVVNCTITADVVITCGAGACTVGTQECCHDITAATGTCQTAGTTCAAGTAPQSCDDRTDCGGAPNACCVHLSKTSTVQDVVCTTSVSACMPTGQGSVALLCNPMEAQPCPTGMTCTLVPARGWYQCQ